MDKRHSDSPRLKKFRTQKILASLFCDKDGVLLIKYMPKGRTISTKHYMSLFDEVCEALKQKRCGKLSHGVLLLQSNAPEHNTWKIGDLGFESAGGPP